MHSHQQLLYKILLFISFLLFLTSCTAGSDQFSSADGDGPAGFWYGLWHGAIAVITLIIHLFNDTVMVYEKNNTGGWYDFGFLLGVIIIWGGGCHAKCKTKQRKQRDKEWEEIGDKVEVKVMRKLKNWAEQDESDDGPQSKAEWDEVCDKVESKLKRKLREWAEKD